jgi:hypothetical protein
MSPWFIKKFKEMQNEVQLKSIYAFSEFGSVQRFDSGASIQPPRFNIAVKTRFFSMRFLALFEKGDHDKKRFKR